MQHHNSIWNNKNEYNKLLKALIGCNWKVLYAFCAHWKYDFTFCSSANRSRTILSSLFFPIYISGDILSGVFFVSMWNYHFIFYIEIRTAPDLSHCSISSSLNHKLCGIIFFSVAFTKFINLRSIRTYYKTVLIHTL